MDEFLDNLMMASDENRTSSRRDERSSGMVRLKIPGKRLADFQTTETVRSEKTRRITGPIITIKAGKELDEIFAVHKFLLKERPTFFNSALGKTRWKESITDTVELPEDEPDVVAAYVEWLYQGKIASKTGTAQPTIAEDRSEDIYLATLYGFGEKMQDNKFCNAIITAWTEKHDQLVEGEYRYHYPGSVRIIYETTPEGSPARKYIVDVFSKYGSKRWLTKREHGVVAKWNYEFLFDLAVKGLNEEQSVRNVGDKLVGRKGEWFKKE